MSRRKGWVEGSALAVFDVLAGAYRGKAVEDRNLLTHAILVDAEGYPAAPKSLCGRISGERLCDVPVEGAPTCPLCAERAARA